MNCFEEQAKRRVQVGLLLSEVVSHNELKADEDRVKTMIADIASAYEQPQSNPGIIAKTKS